MTVHADDRDGSTTAPSRDGGVGDGAPPPPDLRLCEGARVDVLHDPRHCGGCGVRCAAGSVCALGSCRAVARSQLSTNGATNCAVDVDHAMRCWGAFLGGELGAPEYATDSNCIRVPGEAPRVVEGGDHNHCTLDAGGRVACWGDIPMLGDDTPLGSRYPVSIPGFDGVTSVSVGTQGACVVRADASVWCWGSNIANFFVTWNIDYPMVTRTPVALPGLVDVAQVSVMQYAGCALLRNGTVSCWGARGDWFIPSGSDPSSREPVRIGGLENIVSIAVGATHACAVEAPGFARCWGHNTMGELGVSSGDSTEALRVEGLTDVVEVVVGTSHSCARVASGAVWCWGDDTSGQLGDGRQVSRATPARVTGLDDAVDLAAAQERTCARRRTGAVVCWGNWASPPLVYPVHTQPVASECVRECPAGTVWCGEGCSDPRRCGG